MNWDFDWMSFICGIAFIATWAVWYLTNRANRQLVDELAEVEEARDLAKEALTAARKRNIQLMDERDQLRKENREILDNIAYGGELPDEERIADRTLDGRGQE